MKKAVKWGIVGASTLGVLYSWYCVVPSFYQKWVSRKAIRRIPRPEGKEIVLTFDDGPDPAVHAEGFGCVEEVWDIGTFFCCGGAG